MLFDEILQHVGQFGVYQLGVYVVLGMAGVLTGWNNLAVTFTGANMKHWCQVDALSNLSFDLQKYIMAPPDEAGRTTYSQCYMYTLDYSSFSRDDFLTWNRSVMVNESTPTAKCGSWVYDQSVFTSTIRSKWDLVCDRDFLVQVVQTCFMAGFLVGSAVFGQLSDLIGRVKTLIVAIFVQVLFNAIETVSPFYWLYCVSRFMVGVGLAGVFPVYTVLLMEVIGPRYRVVCAIMAHDFVTLGSLTQSGFSWAIRDHHKLQLLTTLLTAVFLFMMLLYWFIEKAYPGFMSVASESPRWLVSVRRDVEARCILGKMAAVNGTQLPEELILEENRNKVDTSTKKPTVLDLLRGYHIRMVTLKMWLCWFVVCVIYYGLSLGVRFLKGSLFLNNTISALVQIPAHALTCIALQRFGRRWPLFLTFLIAGLFSVACIPLVGSTKYDWLFTTFLMLGKAAAAGLFSMLYVYAAEVFPTNLRNVGLGSSSTIARVGGLLQPQIAISEKLWAPLPFLVYGALSILVASVAIFLPETKDRDLPETIEDMTRDRTIDKASSKSMDQKKTIQSNAKDNTGFDMGETDTMQQLDIVPTLQSSYL